MKKYKVIIAPSSADEDYYENATTFEEALEVFNRDEVGGSLYEFDTEQELKAFLEGYEAAIGYLGDGFFMTNNERVLV